MHEEEPSPLHIEENCPFEMADSIKSDEEEKESKGNSESDCVRKFRRIEHELVKQLHQVFEEQHELPVVLEGMKG